MKKIILIVSIIAAVALAVIFALQDPTERELIREVKRVNYACPIGIEADGAIDSITYNRNKKELTYHLHFDKKNVNIYAMKKNVDLFRNALLYSNNDKLEPLIDRLIKIGAGLTYSIHVDPSPATADINISTAELKEFRSEPFGEKAYTRAIFDCQLAAAKCFLPMNLDQGMIAVRISEESDNVTYYIWLDENLYDLSSVKDDLKSTKDTITEELKKSETREFFEKIIFFNKGLRYHYYGSQTGRSFDIVLTPEELKEYL